jgi:hypothetical protein
VQQPLGQEVASHTHWPDPVSQRCPLPVLHALQTAPPWPQAPLVSLA